MDWRDLGLELFDEIRIVPAGLYYRAKQTFRSAALLHYGEPFVVPTIPLAPGAEPPAEAVLALTERIGKALAELTLQAERVEALALVARAQRIFSTADEPPATPAPLAQELEVQRRFVLGYRLLQEKFPDRFTAVQARIDRYESALQAAGLDPRHLTSRTYTFARVLRYVVQSVLVFALLLPPALAGALVHFPAYRIVGYVATGISKGDESALATVKLLAATLLFPLTWAALGVAVWISTRGNLVVTVVTVAVLPVMGLVALVFFERLDRLIGRIKALGLLLFRKWAFMRLVAERRAIRAEIIALGKELGLVVEA